MSGTYTRSHATALAESKPKRALQQAVAASAVALICGAVVWNQWNRQTFR